jgi:nascent polypeptide-associated complex subunit alpha
MMPGMGGVDPRQMSMMMRKMGIEMRDIEGVQEVVIRTKEKEYRFARATVSVMKAQGTETWQVQGKPTVSELGGASAQSAPNSLAGKTDGAREAASTPAAPLVVPEEDVRMVMEQTGKDRATARKTLEECGGDLAEAIVKLS